MHKIELRSNRQLKNSTKAVYEKFYDIIYSKFHSYDDARTLILSVKHGLPAETRLASQMVTRKSYKSLL